MRIFNDYSNWKCAKIAGEPCIDLNSCSPESREILEKVSVSYGGNRGYLHYAVFFAYMLDKCYYDELKTINIFLFMVNNNALIDTVVNSIGQKKYDKLCEYCDNFFNTFSEVNDIPFGYLKKFCTIQYPNNTSAVYNKLLKICKFLESNYPNAIYTLYSTYNGRTINHTGYEFFKYICDNIIFTDDIDKKLNIVDVNKHRVISENDPDRNRGLHSEIYLFAKNNSGLKLHHLLSLIGDTFGFKFDYSFFEEIQNYMFDGSYQTHVKNIFSDIINIDKTFTIKGTVFILVMMFCVTEDGFNRPYIFNNQLEKGAFDKIKNLESKAVLDILYITEKLLKGDFENGHI